MINILKTITLLGVLSVIFIFIGGLIGGQNGIYLALGISLLINGAMYFYSDKLALAASGAKPLGPSQHPELHQMIKELAAKMNMPMPKLYITPMQQANAFATGRSPKHASVAVTEGILKILSKEELRGVLAHELSHVKNRDILVASIAAVFASAISFLANMAMFSGLTGGGDDEEGNPMSGIGGLLIAIIIPIAASIIQLAISRQREYGADETGAKTIGDGKPLAKALLAIHATTRQAPANVNPAYSSLYIDNPTGGLGNKLMNLFSTHPPVEERVKRLEKI
jgi:heat shock protein HtpX